MYTQAVLFYEWVKMYPLSFIIEIYHISVAFRIYNTSFHVSFHYIVFYVKYFPRIILDFLFHVWQTWLII